MKVVLSNLAVDSLEAAPLAVTRAFNKQIKFLMLNIHHPSLRAKKYDETNDIWQARVTRDWRLYFKIAGDTYRIIDLIPHPK